jgi:hypothetical protein
MLVAALLLGIYMLAPSKESICIRSRIPVFRRPRASTSIVRYAHHVRSTAESEARSILPRIPNCNPLRKRLQAQDEACSAMWL